MTGFAVPFGVMRSPCAWVLGLVAACAGPQESEKPFGEDDDGTLYRGLMVAVAVAYCEGRFADAEAMAELALKAWPDDPLAHELLGDCRRMRHRCGGPSLYRDELRAKHDGLRASLLGH